jgi:hypothetical protein
MNKFCVNCKHYRHKSGIVTEHYCTHPNNTEINLVTGSTIYRNSPQLLRSNLIGCSTVGVWYEEKSTK